MEILRELIATVKDHGILDTADLDPMPADVRIGVFYTGVKLSTGHAGIAYTPIHDLPDAVCCPRSHAKMPQSGELLSHNIDTLMNYSLEEKSPLKAAIGVATLNALSAILLEREDCPYKIDALGNALDLVEITKDDTVGMIGAFPPFIKQLKGACKKLHVFEKNPWLKREEGVELQPETLEKDVLPDCDVLIITGVTIVNHTLGPILESCRGAREVVLVGPTASLYPEPFFRRGVTIMGGIRVTNPDKVMNVLTEGGSGYDLFEKSADRVIIKRSPVHAKI